MSLIKSALFALSLSMFSNAYAVTVWLNDTNLRNQDGHHMHIGYQKQDGYGCGNSNMSHNVKLTWARFGYEFITPYPTPATANKKICVNTECDKGGTICPGGDSIDESHAVNNVPECVIEITADKGNRFKYSTECGV